MFLILFAIGEIVLNLLLLVETIATYISQIIKQEKSIQFLSLEMN